MRPCRPLDVSQALPVDLVLRTARRVPGRSYPRHFLYVTRSLLLHEGLLTKHEVRTWAIVGDVDRRLDGRRVG